MPKFALIRASIPCPRCGGELVSGGTIGFQWGYCAAAPLDPDDVYAVGDSILWRLDSFGHAKPWVYFPDGSANIDDPANSDVVVRETQFDLRRCESCLSAHGGIVVSVRRGVVEGVELASPGHPAAEICVVAPGDVVAARPEWDDHPMSVVPAADPAVIGGCFWWEGCGRPKTGPVLTV